MYYFVFLFDKYVSVVIFKALDFTLLLFEKWNNIEKVLLKTIKKYDDNLILHTYFCHIEYQKKNEESIILLLISISIDENHTIVSSLRCNRKGQMNWLPCGCVIPSSVLFCGMHGLSNTRFVADTRYIDHKFCVECGKSFSERCEHINRHESKRSRYDDDDDYDDRNAKRTKN